jgi:hypothetical protein
VSFSLFTSLFIEFKGTLEVPRNPRNSKINPKAISIIGLVAHSSLAPGSVLDHCPCVLDHICALECNMCSILGWGARAHRLSTLDHSVREQNIQSCLFMLQFLESIHFLQKPVKIYKTQKESKIAQDNKIMKLTNVN